MKKSNRFMRLSGVLLVLTLVTSCFMGGTLAKYVSEDEGKDSARVAKWGVEVNVKNGVEEIFGKKYGKHWTGSTINSDTVIAETNAKLDVLAPGTKGELGQTSITGIPEVAVKVVTDAEIIMENWKIDTDEFYCPLIFTVESNNSGTGSTKEDKISGIDYNEKSSGGQQSFINKLENCIEEAYSGEFAAGTNLEEKFTNFNISWEWPYAGKDEDRKYGDSSWTEQEGQKDTKDTKLGDLSADAQNEEDAPNITIKITTTVTQID